MIHDRVTISLDTYLVLIEDHNLGEAPTALGGGERWYSDEELAGRRNAAYQELASNGVFQRGRVTDEFMETIHVLHRPAVDYYSFSKIDGRVVTIRTCTIGKDAVLMMRSNDTLVLYPGEPEQLPQQLVRWLPEHHPANAPSLSCRHEDYQAAIADKPVASGSSGRDAKHILRWLNVEPGNHGELVTELPSQNGRRKVTERTPRWIDTDHGRLLVHLDNSGYLNLVPGNPTTLTNRLTQLETELRGR